MDRARRLGDAFRHAISAALLILPGMAMPALAQQPTLRAEPVAWQADTVADNLNGDTKLTRFVVHLDRPVQPLVQTLQQRVVIDLPDVKMQLPPPSDGPIGLVQNFSGGLAGPGRNRIIIEVAQPVSADARVETSRDGRSHRLVVELAPQDTRVTTKKALPKPSALGAAGVEPPQPRPASAKVRPAVSTFKPTIVIDPGHGGHDSGAMKHGTVEKDVVLQFSLALRDKLRASGRYNVLMTRDTDVFVPLDERREFAEKNRAQLFIAVHADYASTQARGATIYSLREGMFNSLKRSAKVTEQLPDKHQAVIKQTGGDAKAVEGILSELAQREVERNDNSTSLFREKAIREMDATTTMRDNPEQSANFRVLLTATVPSVLIELAYVSNQQDAKLLKSDEWRNKVSESIATAVEGYFANQRDRLPM